MNKNSVTQDIRRRYIEDNLECGQIINYTDLTEKDRLEIVLYEDLPNTEVKGYPIASDYVDEAGKPLSSQEYDALREEERKKCKLRYHFMPCVHELYIGTTGSGKTTGCVEPQLRAISSQKNKANIFVTDPKGELFDRNARHLKENGYRLYMLNFKDLTHSDKWNPLLEVYEKQMSIQKLGHGKRIKNCPVPAKLEMFAPAEEFAETYIEYDGKAFPNMERCLQYVAFQRDCVQAEVSSMVNQLANMFIQPKSKNDPSWEYGAQDLLKGLIMCMLEDALDRRSGFTRDMMTIRTLQQYYLAVRTSIMNSTYSLHSHPLTKNKSNDTRALMATALNNAPNTMKSYCGVFDGALKDWMQAHIFALTTGNTVTLDEEDDRPFAIFVVTRDYEKSDFQVAGLFVDWVYRTILQRAEQGKNQRPLHFLLDEFGNVPAIKDFENKIATARSRNIWFHLSVQSYMQIDVVYGAERGEVIRDNCNAQIFLGAQNRKTKDAFSEECGQHYIPSLESKLNPSDISLTKTPVVPVSDLEKIQPGEMYIKRLFMPVITSRYVRSYVAAARGDYPYFTHPDGLRTCTPLCFDPFTSEKFTYAKIAECNKKSVDFDDMF